MQHLHSGRPEGKEVRRPAVGPKLPAREAAWLCELRGPFRLRESGRARGGRSQAAKPIPHGGGPVRGLDLPPARLRPCLDAGGARARAVRMERRPPGCSGQAGQKGAPAPLRPPPPRKPPRHPDQASQAARTRALPGPAARVPAGFPAAPRPLRPLYPAAPGHAARRAGAGSSPAWPPAPLPLGTQPIGQAGGPPRP